MLSDNPKTLLRVFLVIGYALTLFGMIFDDSLNDTMPTEFQFYLDRMMLEETSRSTEISLMLGFPFFIGAMIAPIGLFFFKKWAVWLYIISGIGLTIALFGFEPWSPQHVLFMTTGTLGAIVYGFVLGIIFFTDAVYSKNTELNNQIN